MADRSRRVVKKHGQTRAAGALAQLAELRRSGKKQAEVYELKEEEDLYDEVEESEYNAKLFREREDGEGASSNLLLYSIVSHVIMWR